LDREYALRGKRFRPETLKERDQERGKAMRKPLTDAFVGLVAMLVFASMAMAQMAQSQATQGNEARSPWKYYPKDIAPGDGGPAPKRDLSGTWAGPGSSPAVPRGAAAEKPSLTPSAQQLMSERKPIGKFGPAGANDPTARYCDPFGFPQNVYNEGRALSIATMPNRVVILFQYMDVWREIWTDGRALPTKVGGSDKDSLDPTYMGYSVGHWEDDYNFVVDTTGLDERTWVTNAGYPHSVNAHVQERYTRVDHNTMKLSLTIEDPTMYTKPFSLGTYNYKWLSNQKFNEWLCLPSEQIKYLTEQGEPAGSFPDAPPARYGGGR
jgi:hypothetical protein